MLQLTKQFITK